MTRKHAEKKESVQQDASKGELGLWNSRPVAVWSDGESGLVFFRRFFKVFLTVSVSGRTQGREGKGREGKGKERREEKGGVKGERVKRRFSDWLEIWLVIPGERQGEVCYPRRPCRPRFIRRRSRFPNGDHGSNWSRRHPRLRRRTGTRTRMTTSIRLPWLVTSSSSSYSLFYYWSESLFWNRNVSNGPLSSSFFYDAGCRICYWPSHEASCVCKACTRVRYWCRLLLGQLFVVPSIYCAFSPYREPQSPHHMLDAEETSAYYSLLFVEQDMVNN